MSSTSRIILTQLPQELIDHIVLRVDGSRYLKQCALAHRSMLHMSQRRIFESLAIIITHAKDRIEPSQRLLGVFIASPHLARYVRMFNILAYDIIAQGEAADQDSAGEVALHVILPMLSNLEILHLAFPKRRISNNLVHALALPSLVALTIEADEVHRSILDALPCLQQLHCINVLWISGTETVPLEPALLPIILKLQLTYYHLPSRIEALTDLFTSHGYVDKLISLDVTWFTISYARLDKLLLHCQKTIQQLALRCPRSLGNGQPMPDITVLHDLQELGIMFLGNLEMHLREQQWLWLFETLEFVRPLRKLALHFSEQKPALIVRDPAKWRQLDDLLASPRRKFATVEFSCVERAQKLLQQNLPRTTANLGSNLRIRTGGLSPNFFP
ncbi:hypothetical protein BD626DRAFT_222260 [Schizophyllum amplum]|uniref:F-box domain-containing protein n=1 Tax=Schizophyllum amplum TaxID=97359 RepID=A0A550BXH1_9AGAR|nr:hypothetical protein BD626DRAFT_222260 [Auriculariopsis ampla]